MERFRVLFSIIFPPIAALFTYHILEKRKQRKKKDKFFDDLIRVVAMDERDENLHELVRKGMTEENGDLLDLYVMDWRWKNLD